MKAIFALPQVNGNICIRINSEATTGEYALDMTPQDLIAEDESGNRLGMVEWAYQDVDGVVIPITPAAAQVVLDAKEVLITKLAAEAQIRSTYEINSNAPVPVTIPEGTFAFVGGRISARDISDAVDLAKALGETNLDVTDVDNVRHTMTFESAMIVSATIGHAFRTAFFAKQDALIALNV